MSQSLELGFEFLGLSLVDRVVVGCCLLQFFVLGFKGIEPLPQSNIFVQKLVVLVSGTAQLLLSDGLDLFGVFGSELNDLGVKLFFYFLDLFKLSVDPLKLSVELSLILLHSFPMLSIFPFKFSVDVSLLAFSSSIQLSLGSISVHLLSSQLFLQSSILVQ